MIFSRMMMSGVTAASGFTPAAMSSLALTIFPGTAHTALYQERTGVFATTPATAHNDPVGTVHDLITGRYVVAPSDAARPLLGIGGGGSLVWLDFGGTKRLSTSATIDLTGTDKVFACACVTKMIDVAFGVLVEHGADTFSSNGAFVLGQRDDGVNIGYGALMRGTARTGYWLNTYAAAHNAIVDANFDIAGASTATEVFPFVNDAAPSTALWETANAGTGNFGLHSMHVGARSFGTNYGNFRLYGLLVRGVSTTGTDRDDVIDYMSMRIGGAAP